jgi:hypothetical protein
MTYDRERNVAALAAPAWGVPDRREQALDTGFEAPPPRQSLSQRAVAAIPRSNGRATDVSDLPA